jgi:hypothetical protein
MISFIDIKIYFAGKFTLSYQNGNKEILFEADELDQKTTTPIETGITPKS